MQPQSLCVGHAQKQDARSHPYWGSPAAPVPGAREARRGVRGRRGDGRKYNPGRAQSTVDKKPHHLVSHLPNIPTAGGWVPRTVRAQRL